MLTDKIIKAVHEDIPKINSQLEQNKNELNARIDTFTTLKEGSTTGDAELIDGRVGANGKIYENIGNAIRNQFNNNSYELDGFSELKVSKNLFDNSKITKGFLNNGSIFQSDSYYTSEYIKVKEGMFINFRDWTTTGSMRFLNFFNDNQVFHSALQNIGSVQIPSGVTSIRFSFGAERINNEIMFTLTETANGNIPYEEYFKPYRTLKNKDNVITSLIKASPFYGKKVAWFGDSVIQNDWWKVVSDLFNMTSINCGVGGTKISGNDVTSMNTTTRILGKYADVEDGNTGQITSNGVAIPENIDFIFIGAGTNDWAQSIALGVKDFQYNSDYSDINYTNATFYQACHTMFKNLKALRPNAKIIVLGTPLGLFSNRYGTNKYGIINGQGLSTLDYEKALCDVAEMWGVNNFRYGSKMGIDITNVKTLLDPTQENGHLHPTTDIAKEKFRNTTINEMLKIKYI